MNKSKYILCDFTACGQHESCARYCPTMVKRKTPHIGKLPPKADKGKCTLFELKESDDLPSSNTLLHEPQSPHL